MLVKADYNRKRAIEYANVWALSRNPLFLDYEGIGGDCTSFASQVLYAGSCIMNFTPISGWYYITDAQRSASWTGVEFFYKFLIENIGIGPFGREVFPDEAIEGDIIQLSDENDQFYHTLIITGVEDNEFLVSAHSVDSNNRPLSSYDYSGLRYIHIEGVRYEMEIPYQCFDDLLAGVSLNIV